MKIIEQNCIERTHEKTRLLTLDLSYLGHRSRKAFCGQRILEFGRARKESVDKAILITSREDDRKIMQLIRITSGPTASGGSGTSSGNSDEQLPK